MFVISFVFGYWASAQILKWPLSSHCEGQPCLEMGRNFFTKSWSSKALFIEAQIFTRFYKLSTKIKPENLLSFLISRKMCCARCIASESVISRLPVCFPWAGRWRSGRAWAPGRALVDSALALEQKASNFPLTGVSGLPGYWWCNSGAGGLEKHQESCLGSQFPDLLGSCSLVQDAAKSDSLPCYLDTVVWLE